jgi:putative transposase
VKTLYQSFLLLLGAATDRELARHVQFYKVENQLLRSKVPGRITVTPEERRRLLKFGKPVGPAIKDLITIVSPRTFARWVSGETKAKRKPAREPKLGRPRTEEAIRDLILKLARETS